MPSDTLGRNTPDHFSGCLLGGAVGDALGAAVEFIPIDLIRKKYGAQGITDYDETYGRRGAITDDTQMTLFTAEGALRAIARERLTGSCDKAAVIHQAYVRWLRTQAALNPSFGAQKDVDGWLVGVEALHKLRAPGNTCLTALCADRMGTMDRPLNHSKGCGGVMRMAPIGLVADTAESAFGLACQAAAITHGHPSGYYSAGAFAAIIFVLRNGQSLLGAVDTALHLLVAPGNKNHQECAAAIQSAVDHWRDSRVIPSPESVQQLGGGWVGEQALAVALYCALHAGDDFARGVCLAVNHSGDSDSTGAITGNLLGLMLGRDAIPSRWVSELELRDEIQAMARDLRTQFENSEAWSTRYPAGS
jgi:ADP-ribosylglycohydrolase